MNASPQKKIYVLDTNILIGFYQWIPIDLNKNFWTKFEESLKKGEWVLLDVVVDEIKFENDLKKWCVEQKKNSLVKNIDENCRNRGVEINNAYKMIDEATQNSTADTYLIAYAEANNLVIFSREGRRTKDTDLYKIPDVCDILKIEVIRNPIVFLRTIGFKN